ncbi:hypothetical protein [Sphingobacterium rhinopitheci]|uniref:hypothetical protein n=1 Tax=Sphingobacterium rhinopitheci TaxID=2781960 RepID=UPI001F5169E2|nr:hypothetical protein [Sphingobacterium rhinopitheci]MCI0919847.1 hypothetical protein [Sphingobacterium rhinopitheci]
MKTYEDYKAIENFISLGHLSIYNDLLKTNNLKADYKIWDGAIFLLLAHIDVDKLLSEEFKDYKKYFDILLIESNIIKKENNHLYNCYRLKYKN